ncbi:MAG: nucleotide exchange factor GrpE, partial [Oscillospiraceae bacterium]
MAKTKEEKKKKPQPKAETPEVLEKKQTEEQVLKDEINDLNEKYLRLAAEYDNFRKRSQKERESVYADAKASVLSEILPVIDNFDRANEISDPASEDYKKGIDMTFAQLLQIFEKLGVESFGAA